MRSAAQKIADALGAGVAARGRACAALSGGTSPEAAYALLAQHALDWARISIAQVDERVLASGHRDRNETMIRRALGPAFAQGARFLSLCDDGGGAAERTYAALDVDIALMGMGRDGHTASWFAGAAGLAAALSLQNQAAIAAITAPQADAAQQRLTLTRAALSRARRLVLLIAGEGKRKTLEAADAAGAPVAALWAPGMPQLEILWAA